MRVQNGDIELAAHVAGDHGDTVLLVSPADSPSFRWTPAVVEPLVAAGYRVVRYDHRDVGSSSACEQPYDLGDLADDALAVIAATSTGPVHVIGRSMGGMVGQLLALDRGELVRSLTIVGSTPSFGDESLSAASDELVERLTWRLFDGPPQGRAERVGWLVEGYRAMAGLRFPFETRLQRSLALREVDECWRPETGHGSAVADSTSRLARLGGIERPTLIVHGTSDPVFGPDHAIAIADSIDGAHLHLVEGLGHELPDAYAPTFVELWLRTVGR